MDQQHALRVSADVLLESAPDAVVVIDSDSRVVTVNGQAERLFGWARREFVGRDLGDLLPAARRADGTAFAAEVALRPLDGPGGRLIAATVRDVSAHHRATDELARMEALFRSAFDDAPTGKALVTGGLQVERANAALGALLGAPPDRLAGAGLETIVHPDDRADLAAGLAGLRPGRTYAADLRLLHDRGHTIWAEVQATAVAAPPGEPAGGAVLQVQDVTDRRRHEDNVRYLATHDPLTGLLNRASFSRELEVHAGERPRRGAAGAVLLLDLDHFKFVNDTLGHQAGDVLIARVADVLVGALPAGAVVARIGGDEFAVLLPRAGVTSARRVAGDLRRALRAEAIAVPGTRDRTITASIGIAPVPDTEHITGEDLLVTADLAMYDAKDAGRNRVVVMRPGGSAEGRTSRRISWGERIMVAIEQDRFKLFGQPIVELASGRMTHFEVLLRMTDDEGAIIPPAAFLPIAERLDMVQQIDALTVRNALRLVAEHGRDADTRVEINLSGASLGDPAILEHIERELASTGIDPRRVVFEITETIAISNISRAREFSRRLSRLGCGFALDDFGAGFGSFYYLKHLDFDFLKIDGEFVRDCVRSDTDRLVIESVVGIARGLGRQTVAEHVTDQATVRRLEALGVDYGQGYHLGVPVALEDLLAGR